MFQRVSALSWVSFCTKLMWISLLSYSLVTTIILVRLDLQPIIIGIDSYGTRIIRSPDDRLIKQEKENFLKRFLALQYNYTAETFENHIQESGDLMSKDLWEKRLDEFQRILAGLKTESIDQRAVIQDLREIDLNNYQADLVLEIVRKLTKNTVKLRVDLKLRPNKRNAQNPFPYEVDSYEEQISP